MISKKSELERKKKERIECANPRLTLIINDCLSHQKNLSTHDNHLHLVQEATSIMGIVQ